jgi:hypothetical protein
LGFDIPDILRMAIQTQKHYWMATFFFERTYYYPLETYIYRQACLALRAPNVRLPTPDIWEQKFLLN